MIADLDEIIDAFAAQYKSGSTDRYVTRVDAPQFAYFYKGERIVYDTTGYGFVEVTQAVHERAGANCYERCPGGACPWSDNIVEWKDPE